MSTELRRCNVGGSSIGMRRIRLKGTVQNPAPNAFGPFSRNQICRVKFMDLSALWDNVRRSRSRCLGFVDTVNCLLWLYSHILGGALLKRNRVIAFCYPPPVGSLRVVVRGNSGADAFIFGEVFDHLYYDFDLPSTPTSILDLGANIGFATLFLARKYPAARIACVEPIPDNVKLLRENLTLNQVPASVFDAAVSVADGRITMEIAKKDYGHKVADLEFGATLDGTRLEVESVSVPTLLERLGWERIGLLKVDIEGYEGILFKQRSEWLAKVDALCIECHEGFGLDDLRAVAQEFGFCEPRRLPGTWLLVRPTLSASSDWSIEVKTIVG